MGNSNHTKRPKRPRSSYGYIPPTINNSREVSWTQLNTGPGLQGYPAISHMIRAGSPTPKRTSGNVQLRFFEKNPGLLKLETFGPFLQLQVLWGKPRNRTYHSYWHPSSAAEWTLVLYPGVVFLGKLLNHPWMQMDQMVWEWVEKVTGTHRASQGLWSTKVCFFLLVF